MTSLPGKRKIGSVVRWASMTGLTADSDGQSSTS